MRRIQVPKIEYRDREVIKEVPRIEYRERPVVQTPAPAPPAPAPAAQAPAQYQSNIFLQAVSRRTRVDSCRSHLFYFCCQCQIPENAHVV